MSSVSPSSSASQHAVESITVAAFDYSVIPALVSACGEQGMSPDQIVSVLDKTYATYHAYSRAVTVVSPVSSRASSDAGSVTQDGVKGGGSVPAQVRARGKVEAKGGRISRVGSRHAVATSEASALSGIPRDLSKYDRCMSSVDWRANLDRILGPGERRLSSSGVLGSSEDKRGLDGYCYRRLFTSELALVSGAYPSVFELMAESAKHLKPVEELRQMGFSVRGGVCHIGDKGDYPCLEVLRALAGASAMPYLSADSLWAKLRALGPGYDPALAKVCAMTASVGAQVLSGYACDVAGSEQYQATLVAMHSELANAQDTRKFVHAVAADGTVVGCVVAGSPEVVVGKYVGTDGVVVDSFDRSVAQLEFAGGMDFDQLDTRVGIDGLVKIVETRTVVRYLFPTLQEAKDAFDNAVTSPSVYRGTNLFSVVGADGVSVPGYTLDEFMARVFFVN